MNWKAKALEMANKGDMSWREIAKRLGVPRSTVSDYLRNNINKNVSTGNVLVISDMHLPFQHKDTFRFLQALKDKYKPSIVVCIGDECDKHSLSYHESETSLPSANDELAMATKHILELEKMFPEMYLVESNHGSLAYRKAKTVGIPNQYLKSYNEVYGVGSGWKWMDHLVMNIHGQDVLFIHGKTTDVTKVSKANSMCVVQGHYHTLSKVEWWQPYGYGNDKPKRRWAMQVGCLIDNSSAAFNYNKQSPIAPIISCGIIVNGKPEIVFMEDVLTDNKG